MTVHLADSSVNTFISEIYGTVADPQLWPSVLDKFADMVDARGCIVFELEGDGADRQMIGAMMSSGYEPEKLLGYLAAFGKFEAEDQDRFEALSLERDDIDLIECNMLFDSESELLARPNVQAMVANDMRYRAAGLLNKDDRKRARFSVQRSERNGPFGDKDREVIRVLLPHVAKAIELSRPAHELARAHGALMEAMDRLRIGVCVIDRRGYRIVSNQEFERQRDRHSIFRVDPSGRLHVNDHADPKRFDVLCAGAQGHGQYGARPRREAIITDRDDPASAVCIEIVPFEQVDAFGVNRFDGAIVYSTDTSEGFACDTSALRSVFNLTDAETETAKFVCEGMTNRLIADHRDRAVETINAQVKALLTKTGCKTRTEFVRLVMGFGTQFVRSEDNDPAG